MIFTDRTITVQKGASFIDEPIILYRGDKEAEIRFALNEKVPFKFGSGTDSNMIEKTEAAYGQLIIKTPNGLPSIFSDVAPTKKGQIVFKITAEMIDEVTEVGKYTFQIRLLDEGMNARVTLPEVNDGIEIREPIAQEDVTSTNEVNVATAGYALTTAGVAEDAFDSQGNYNKTTWGTGDRITDAKLNKIEAAIDGVNKKIASGGTGGSGDNSIDDATSSTSTTYSSNKIESIKEDLSSRISVVENYSLVKHTDGKVYIKKQDGTLIGTGVEVGSDADLSKVTMSVEGQILKLLNDGTQIATVEIPTATVTDEQLTTIIQSKIEDGTLSALSIEDGSIGIDKTTLVNKLYKNVYDFEKIKTDSNYLAIRNPKANTKYYVRATWTKNYFLTSIIYSLNESTNSKTNVGTLATETIDGVDYYTFTLTSDYDLIGLFRADDDSIHSNNCTLAAYGFEIPFQLETVDIGLNENWKNPMVKYLSPIIETNTLSKFSENDNSTDKIITPNKTDFVEITNTKTIGCYNYADVTYNTILGNYPYTDPDSSKSEKELQYRWYSASYTSWATKLGITGNGYGIFLLPLTPGIWYIRRLVRNVYSPNTKFSVIGFANPDIATNPTTILNDSGIEITNYQRFTYTDNDGIQHNDEVIDFGEWNYINNSGSCGSSSVCLHKVVIPDGVYGFITGSPTSVGAEDYPTGHNELYTIMDYNPIDDILQTVEDSFQTETLKPVNKYEKGFIANLADSNKFSDVIKNNIDSFIPSKYAKHTFGKKLIIHGDSLTQYAGGDGKTGDGFLTLANRYLGMNMVQKGYAGSNWSGSNPGDAPAKVNKLISDKIDYDVILLAWGTNPDNSNGNITDEASSTGSMVSVMKWAFTELRYNYPMAGIGVIIPPPSLSFNEDKANLMIDVCKSEGIPYLNMFHEGGISINANKNGGLNADQVHLHYVYGSSKYATALISFIERICPCVNYYKITKVLTNVSTTSTLKYLFDVSKYTITLTPDDGYTIDTVTVTMGGIDVTSSTYANGKVTINGCTGDIVITASATQTTTTE